MLLLATVRNSTGGCACLFITAKCGLSYSQEASVSTAVAVSEMHRRLGVFFSRLAGSCVPRLGGLSDASFEAVLLCVLTQCKA